MKFVVDISFLIFILSLCRHLFYMTHLCLFFFWNMSNKKLLEGVVFLQSYGLVYSALVNNSVQWCEYSNGNKIQHSIWISMVKWSLVVPEQTIHFVDFSPYFMGKRVPNHIKHRKRREQAKIDTVSPILEKVCPNPYST